MTETIIAHESICWVEIREPKTNRYMGRINPESGLLELRWRGAFLRYQFSGTGIKSQAIDNAPES